MATTKQYLDSDGLRYYNAKLRAIFAEKVDKVANKGLSSNDYTNEEQSKLSGIATGAQVNVIEAISVNGTPVTPTSKLVNISVPTNTNELINGAGYQTASEVSSAISSAIANVSGFEFSVVESLPVAGSAGVIYLVAHTHGSDDGYDEYVWINNAYEKLGHADVDLSDYLPQSAIITNAEIDDIIAGN